MPRLTRDQVDVVAGAEGMVEVKFTIPRADLPKLLRILDIGGAVVAWLGSGCSDLTIVEDEAFIVAVRKP